MKRRIMVRADEDLVGWLDQFGGDAAGALVALATLGAATLGYPGAARVALAEVARGADPRVLRLLVEMAGDQPGSSYQATGEQPTGNRAVARKQLPSNRRATGEQPAETGPPPTLADLGLGEEDDPFGDVGIRV